MGIRKLKPTTPGQRHKVIGAFDKITDPLLTLMAVILPSLSALILFSIFMASNMIMVCPFFTVSPTFLCIQSAVRKTVFYRGCSA